MVAQIYKNRVILEILSFQNCYFLLDQMKKNSQNSQKKYKIRLKQANLGLMASYEPQKSKFHYIH